MHFVQEAVKQKKKGGGQMVAVLSKSGIRLMPTSNYKARRLLKSKRAKIYQYRPFTIQLTDREDGNVQPVELINHKIGSIQKPIR